MKVYAAWSGPEQQAQWMLDVEPIRTLISFAYDRQRTFGERIARHVSLDRVDLMLDSGAFSVWTMGERVDLDEYIAYALAYHDDMDGRLFVINLDVIPGTPGGRAPSTRQRTKAVKAGMANADRMRDAGLKVMEVYHLHEPIRVLDRLIERRQPGELIGLGGLAGRGDGNLKVEFCDAAFRRVYRLAEGWQGIVPLHGLGISPDAPLARKYPWWSIDSSSWSIFHRFGAEVARNGRAQKRSPGATRENGQRSITSYRPASDLYYIRTLRRWRRLEQDFERLWNDRGVTFAADVEAVHA
jgi:hypothetical protein